MAPDGRSIVALLGVLACACRPDASRSPQDVTAYATGVPISGRVLENVDACVVDAACFLRIELSDTTIAALYGTGEREPECVIPAAVFAAASSVRPGTRIEVTLARCGGDGLYIEQLGPIPE